MRVYAFIHTCTMYIFKNQFGKAHLQLGVWCWLYLSTLIQYFILLIYLSACLSVMYIVIVVYSFIINHFMINAFTKIINFSGLHILNVIILLNSENIQFTTHETSMYIYFKYHCMVMVGEILCLSREIKFWNENPWRFQACHLFRFKSIQEMGLISGCFVLLMLAAWLSG